jgi:signal transduction histidine kinase
VQEREFLRALLDSLDEGIVAVDADGGLRLHNDAARDVLGDDPIGAARDGLLARALKGERIREAEVALEERILTVNGQPFFDEEGLKLGAVVALHDVTERRRAERLKDEFFALVSHELRTPLTSIVGYLEVLREDAEDDDAFGDDHRRFLHVIDRNAKRLQRLVGDLLFVAQLEAGRLSLETGSVDLAARAYESVEAGLPRAAEAGVDDRARRPPAGALPRATASASARCSTTSSPTRSSSRRGRARRRAHPPGGRAGDHRGRRHRRAASRRRAWTGCSSASSAQHRHRAADPRHRPGPGDHPRDRPRRTAGDIDVASVEGQGTTFRVELPWPAWPPERRPCPSPPERRRSHCGTLAFRNAPVTVRSSSDT